MLWWRSAGERYAHLHNVTPTGVRPYQGCVAETRIAGSHFNQGVSAQYTKETSLAHYLNGQNQICRDKVSKFPPKCDGLSEGRVIRRIAGIFDAIFIISARESP
jgi:DNA helicase-2/ATP-dependent DNA helicase PcrA